LDLNNFAGCCCSSTEIWTSRPQHLVDTQHLVDLTRSPIKPMVARARLCKGSPLRSDPALREASGLDRDSARAGWQLTATARHRSTAFRFPRLQVSADSVHAHGRTGRTSARPPRTLRRRRTTLSRSSRSRATWVPSCDELPLVVFRVIRESRAISNALRAYQLSTDQRSRA
jgi:hypothetical protein